MSNSDTQSPALQQLLSNRPITLILGLNLIALIAISSLNYLSSRSALQQQISENTLPLVTSQVYNAIMADLHPTIAVSASMATDTFVIDWIEQGEKDEKRIEQYLRQILYSSQASTAYYISDQTKRYYHPNGKLRYIDENNPEEAWFVNAKLMDAPFETLLSEDEMSQSRLTVFVNYRATNHLGKFLGVIGLGQSLDKVNKLINDYQEHYSRNIYFFSAAGKLLNHHGDVGEIDPVLLNTFRKHLIKENMFSDVVLTERVSELNTWITMRYLPELQLFVGIEDPNIEGDDLNNTFMINLLLAITASLALLVFATTRYKLTNLTAYNRELKREVAEQVTQVKKQHEQLILQQRLASMGEMLASVAHQWKQPLASLSGLVINLDNHLREKHHQDSETEQYIDHIDHNIEYMSGTISDFISFFKKSDQRKYFNLSDAIHKVRKMVSAETKSHQITIDLNMDNNPRLYANQSELTQVLFILINNAKDAFNENKITHKNITISATAGDEMVTITVCDNAGGVDPEVLDRILEPYFSTKESGAGLGLHIANTIITSRMQGHLYAENTSYGVCFTIAIPKGC